LLVYYDKLEIGFEKVQNHVYNGAYAIAFADLKNISYENISDIYIADNLIDYNSITHLSSLYGENLVWHICKMDAADDIEFVNSIKPCRREIETVYIFVRKSSKNTVYHGSIDALSKKLRMGKFKIYYCLKILQAIGVIAVDNINNQSFRINLVNIRSSLDKSCDLRRFDVLIKRLYKINIFFQNSKGEY
jgi:hypothetical protein